ncbi:hypothetical protein PG999_007516 [Apiospora kogelbergensis]|uniref:Uncharacterized protein n=1 Tax=Apiospora kogelbergensis TaxID=1337665 RepID=A0AAW0QN96_9PEZI
MIWRNLTVSPVLEMRCEEVQGQACLPEEAELTWQALHPGRVYSTNPKPSVDVGKLNQLTNARQRYSRDCKTGSSCQGAAGRGIVGDGHPEQRSHCHSRRSKFQRTEGSWQKPPIWPGMAAIEAPTDRLPASAPASVSATAVLTDPGQQTQRLIQAQAQAARVYPVVWPPTSLLGLSALPESRTTIASGAFCTVKP